MKKQTKGLIDRYKIHNILRLEKISTSISQVMAQNVVTCSAQFCESTNIMEYWDQY